MESQHYDTSPPKKISLPDGFQVGIVNLDAIIKDVIALQLTDAEVIKAELLARVKKRNYVARTAEGEYSAALFQEYRFRTGEAARPMHAETKESGG